jgi:hypothetical protein
LDWTARQNRDSIGDQIFLELPAVGHLWGALYEEHRQLVGTRTSIRGPADHRCPGVADGSVLTWVTYGKRVPVDTKITECHQIGFMRTVRARACARVMGSYWDAMTTSVAANSDRSRWCRRRKDRPLCGARTRAGGTCIVRVEFGKARCRFHGGLSTGPKTEAGRARIAEAQRRRWAAYREVGPTVSAYAGDEAIDG